MPGCMPHEGGCIGKEEVMKILKKVLYLFFKKEEVFLCPKGGERKKSGYCAECAKQYKLAQEK